MNRHPVASILAAFLAVLPGVQAVDIIRSGASGPLNLDTAWSGSVVPGAGDIAVWEAGSNTGSTTLGADLSWLGIKVIDPAAAFSNGGSNTLTLGAGGIDMSGATVDATFSFNFNLGASQTWQVASGRMLLVNNAAISGGSSSLLTLSGPGSVYMTSATDQVYSGGTLLENGITVYMGNNNGGGNFGTGAVTIRNNVTLAGHTSGIRTLNTLTAFTGSANTLTLGTGTAASQFIMSAGADVGTAARTISLFNPNTPTTSNLALTFAGTMTSGSGGSLILSNGNASPSTEPVWVKFGASSNPAVLNGTVEIGRYVEAYLQGSNELGAGADMIVNGALDVSGKGTGTVNAVIRTLSGSGHVFSGRTNTSANSLTIDGGNSIGSTTFSGSLTNGVTSPLVLTKSGSSTQVLTGVNTYTGATTINGGALQAAGSSLSSGSILQLRGGVLQSSGTFSRAVSTAAGAVNWSTSSGGFAANGGVLYLQLNSGTASLTWNGSSFVSTGQSLIFGSRTADNIVDLQNGLNLGSSGTNTRTITVIDNPNSTADRARISGAITNTIAGQSLLKDGDGILELSNTGNSYTGQTIVNAGTLLVSGNISSSSAVIVNSGGKFSVGSSVTLSNEITVNSGGRIGGNGTYSDATGIVLGAGAIAAPGNSPGNTTYATDLTLASGAIFEWELGAYGTVAGVDSDLLTVTGAGNVLTFDSGSILTLNFLSPVVSPDSAGTGNFWLSNRQWLIAEALSGGSIVDSGLLIQAPSSFTNGSFSISSSGGNLYLDYAAIPEPGTSVLVGLGLVGVLYGIRRRKA